MPYEPLINCGSDPIRQLARTCAVPMPRKPTGPRSATPGPSSLEAPAIKQSAPIARTGDTRALKCRSDPAHQTTQETSSWSQPLNDDQADAHSSDVNAARPSRDVVLTRQQQTPIPQEQQTRPSNVPETTFSKDPVGFQPTPPNSASPIEFSVYNPDVDPGHDELFDLVQDVRDNKTQGDAAEDAELKRIKRENRLAAFAPQTRIYAAGTSDYTVSDIMFRRNGTSFIVITEVKSGDGKLTPDQVATLAEAMRTGKIDITSEKGG